MKKLTTALVALPLAALVLSGCSTTPGTAAVVGKKIITTAEVDRYAGWVAQDTKMEASRFQVQVLNTLITRELANQVGDGSVPDEALVQQVSEKIASPEMLNGPHKSFYVDVAKDSIKLSQASQQKMESLATSLATKIKVNPIYGTFDPSRFMVGNQGPISGSLSRSLDELNPTDAPGDK